ncbi:MAG: hypothetical protein Q7R95_05785, partial [bacterium]|nr:hypothetical protein [bacterium]
MIYLSLNANQIKILVLKKTLLGQQETLFYEKKHETQLLEKGKIINIDIVASAIKEALNLSSPTPLTEKQVFLTLPQETFYFLRADVPNDIAPSAIQAFIRDKARTVLPLEMDNYASEYFIQEADKQKTVTFYAIDKESLEQFQQCLALIDLKLYSILPETLAYFKLFEKTLRREKKESIFYVNYEKDSVSGYLFDSTGLMDAKKWEGNISKDETVEKILKTKTTEYETNKLKLNRLILSGSDSETIRQDTFTKAVGVWTNPLKRIIP